jgi:hypothetical protein
VHEIKYENIILLIKKSPKKQGGNYAKNITHTKETTGN